jgi:hypothetical protein
MNGLSCNFFCHYGETDDAFLIGGAGEPNETLMAGVIRHCIRLVDFRLKPSQRLYLTKVTNGLIDHEPVKMYIFVIDVLFNNLRWKARHHSPRLATITTYHLNAIEASYEEQPGPLPPIVVPTSLFFRLRMELQMSFLFTPGTNVLKSLVVSTLATF